MSRSKSNRSFAVVGKAFSSRFDPTNKTALERARAIRTEARNLRDTVARGEYFVSEDKRFKRLCKTAPSALGESTAVLEDLAGVRTSYIEDIVRDKNTKRRNASYMVAILDAMIATANERLFDVEGPHVARWTASPFPPTSAFEIQRSLEQIVEFLTKTNSLAQVPELNDEWRRHLVQLCRTTILLLEAREVEVGKLTQCGNALEKLSRHPAISHSIAGVAGAVASAIAMATLNPHPSPGDVISRANTTVICAPTTVVSQSQN